MGRQEEGCWPIRANYKDHIDWFLEKNPEADRRAAIRFARSQMGHQIAINRTNIRLAIERIDQYLLEIEKMAEELEKGEGSELI
jgi:hypothetical protein